MTTNFSGSIEYNDESLLITPDILSAIDNKQIEIAAISLDIEFGKRLQLNSADTTLIRFTGKEDSLLIYLDILDLQENLYSNHYQIRMNILLHKLFKTIQLSINTKIFTGIQIQYLQDYIQANLKAPLRIQDLSKIMGINQQYFKQQFKNTFDNSVHEYIKAKRLDKAMYLIQNSDESLGSIALKIGYSSISSFSQAFKNHFGKSPMHYKISKN